MLGLLAPEMIRKVVSKVLSTLSGEVDDDPEPQREESAVPPQNKSQRLNRRLSDANSNASRRSRKSADSADRSPSRHGSKADVNGNQRELFEAEEASSPPRLDQPMTVLSAELSVGAESKSQNGWENTSSKGARTGSHDGKTASSKGSSKRSAVEERADSRNQNDGMEHSKGISAAQRNTEESVSTTSSTAPGTLVGLPRTSNTSAVNVPTFKERTTYHPKPEQKSKWTRPDALISLAQSKPIKTSAYDADEEDETFFSQLKSAKKNWTLNDFERVIELAERELSVVERQRVLDKEDISLKCRNANTIAKSEYVLGAFKSKRTNSSSESASKRSKPVLGEELEQEMTIIGEQAAKDMAQSLEHGTRKSKRGIDELVPIISLADALDVPESDATLKSIYKYWKEKREREAGPLINVNFLGRLGADGEWMGESPNVDRVGMAYTRLRELREDLERVRLVADMARRREKIKKEIVKSSS